LRFFKNFKEKQDFVLTPPAPTPIAQIFGGTLVGLKLQSGGIVFYDWETGLNVRKIDVLPKDVYWSNTGSGDLVAICCEDGFYVLKFVREKFVQKVEDGEQVGAEGFEEAFEFVAEVPEKYALCLSTGCILTQLLVSKPGRGLEIVLYTQILSIG
jgi:coatomer subunit beta'